MSLTVLSWIFSDLHFIYTVYTRIEVESFVGKIKKISQVLVFKNC